MISENIREGELQTQRGFSDGSSWAFRMIQANMLVLIQAIQPSHLIVREFEIEDIGIGDNPLLRI